MTNSFALIGAAIGLGSAKVINSALLISGKTIIDVCAQEDIPAEFTPIQLNGGTLIAGFVDLQVNGGGGLLFNNDPSVDTIKAITKAHARLGTCRTLVTLISADKNTTTKAIEASIQAAAQNIPGFLGLHLEGPHLSQTKKGAHSENALREMNDEDLTQLCEAKKQLPCLMITVAPEIVSNKQIARLAEADIIVSLGHSNASAEQSESAFQHGACCATHLFNAMSPLNHRAPGLPGATLFNDAVYAGIIADGVHVSPAALSLAVRSKQGTGKLFLVSDAMATAGTNQQQFQLDGRTITRSNGRLELADGTLAGADIDMLSSMRLLIDDVGVLPEVAARMASSYPSACIGAVENLGSLTKGHFANVVHLSDDMQLQQVWLDGTSQL